jgi:Arc/MetJ-type ribon-helix-helix transcriptional regulator
MGTTVQARLDEKAQAALQRLVKHHGLTASEVIREGIRLVEQQKSGPKRPRLIGAGCFDSGSTNLATNKKHMEGFGKKWRVDKSGNGRWDW